MSPALQARINETRRSAAGLTAVGVFLCFGAAMAALAAITLLWPGTPLESMWSLNRVAYSQLFPRRLIVGPLFVLLSFVLICAAIGWFQRRRWGWQLAVTIICIQLAGDLVNFLRGDWLRGIIGVLLAGALLAYMRQPALRNRFDRKAQRPFEG
ncbi:MAG: hypothetical protein ACM3WP_06220 [Acidobacteriota bacterium]